MIKVTEEEDLNLMIPGSQIGVANDTWLILPARNHSNSKLLSLFGTSLNLDLWFAADNYEAF